MASNSENLALEESTPSADSTSGENNSHSLSCKVCGRTILTGSLSNRDGLGRLRYTTCHQAVALCDACKKFYCRNRRKLVGEKCSCDVKKCGSCRVCRLERCEAAVLGQKRADELPLMPKVDFTKIPCAVCGVSSSGFHFGVVACEGCKGFFRRSMYKTYKVQYTCKTFTDGSSSNGKLCPTSSSCRKCRLQRCVDAGMSLEKVAIGRHTLRRRAEVVATLKRHSSKGSFLTEKVSRRPVTNEAEDLRISTKDGHPRHLGVRPETLAILSRRVTRSVEAPHGEELIDVIENSSSTTPETEKAVNLSGSSSLSEGNFFTTPEALDLARGYAEHADSHFDDWLNKSSDWFIERAAEAANKLDGISKMRIALDFGATEEQFISAHIGMLDVYMKCISEFAAALPGMTQISVNDRVVLLSQAFFPISAAQLSLNFDVDKQLPNHFSFERDGPAWKISLKMRPAIHWAVEGYLREVGSRFSVSVRNFNEFSLLCALLLLNPDIPGLEGAAQIRSVRYRYDLALLNWFSKNSAQPSEQRLSEIYVLLPLFRQGTSIFQNIFLEVNTRFLGDKQFWTPSFKQLETQISRLSLPPAQQK